MTSNILGSTLVILSCSVPLYGQTSPGSSKSTAVSPSTSPDGSSTKSGGGQSVGESEWQASEGAKAGAKTSVSSSSGGSRSPSLDAHQVGSGEAAVPVNSSDNKTLPNDHGQVWKQYDISVYTEQVKGAENPQQAIVDWILRETGTEVWFTSPLGLLNANRETLSVYHTPEMQRVVAEMVGRFVNGTQDPHALSLKLVSVNSPNWRSNYMRRLRPINVQTPSIEAWLISKEDAALLLAELRRRSDFREYSSTNVVFHNGQTHKLAQRRPRNYVRSYRSRKQKNIWTGYDIDWRQFQEGFTVEISPLLSQDERTIDTVIKCEIDQVEKMIPVGVNLPGFTGQMQRAEIQVPQIVSWRLHERFRWPTSQVLLLSCGVVASPGPERGSTFGFPNPFAAAGRRANALMFVESLGKASQALLPGQGQVSTGESQPANSAGRY